MVNKMKKVMKKLYIFMFVFSASLCANFGSEIGHQVILENSQWGVYYSFTVVGGKLTQDPIKSTDTGANGDLSERVLDYNLQLAVNMSQGPLGKVLCNGDSSGKFPVGFYRAPAAVVQKTSLKDPSVGAVQLCPFIKGEEPIGFPHLPEGFDQKDLMLPFNTFYSDYFVVQLLKQTQKALRDTKTGTFWSFFQDDVTDSMPGIARWGLYANRVPNIYNYQSQGISRANRIVGFCSMQKFLTSEDVNTVFEKLYSDIPSAIELWQITEQAQKNFAYTNEKKDSSTGLTARFVVCVDLTQKNDTTQKIPYGTNAVAW